MKAKKIEKSMRKFARAHRAKNLVAPARAVQASARSYASDNPQPVQVAPTSDDMREIAETDRDGRVREYEADLQRTAVAEFNRLPQPSYGRGEQESTAPWVTPTDQLAHVRVPAPSQVAMSSAPPLASPMHAHAVAALDAIIPSHHRR